MKKRIFTFLFLICFMLPFAFTFAGCGGSKDALFLDGGSSIQLDNSWRENEIINSLPDWQKMLLQNGYKLNVIEELGFYLESEVPDDLIFNETLTTAYDSLLKNSKKKNLVKVYVSEDNTKIAFASEKKIQAPKNCELLFANVWKYASDAKSDCYVNLKVLNLSNFYTDNVTTMQRMFYTSYSLKTLNLTNFNTSKVTDMRAMFANCWGLTELDLSNFYLKKVEKSDWMLDLGFDAKISRLVLPSNWGKTSSLRVLAQYDLYDKLSLEQLTNGGDYSPVFDDYAGKTLIAGDPITYYVDGVIDEELTPINYIEMRGSILPTPNRDHHEFSGWFDNEDCVGTPIEEISPGESGPKTYYGKFTPFNYYISYIVNGEIYSSSSYTYGVGTTLMDLNIDGYTFSGWYENENLTGSKVTKVSTTDYNPKIFYATLTGKTYQIKYYVNGAVKSCTPSSYTCGEGATLPDLSQEHYIFSGWHDNSSCEGSIITEISDEEFGNKTYYANLVPETYNITYIIDNEEDTTLTPSSYAYGTNVTLPQPTKKGHTFSGWFTNSGYTSEKVVSISTTDAGSKTFYGHFEMETYTISYIVDGEDATLTPASYVYGTNVTLPQPSKDDYAFSGWYTDSGYTSEKVVSISTTDTGNKTFYGYFERTTYKISYIVDGKDATLTPSSYDYGTSTTLPQPTQSGYEFSGWFDNENYTGSVVTTISETETGDKQFYGKFTPTPVEFPTTWQTEVASATYMSTTLAPEELTKIQFETTAPNGYIQIGALSTGIEVYQSQKTSTEIAFVWAEKIYLPADMSSMFAGCSKLTSLDLSSFSTSSVTNMSSMFYNCSSLKSLDVSNFDTSNVTDMSSMFFYCLALKSLDLSSFNTSSVTNMSYMFCNGNNLAELNISSFNTSKVTDMSYMFYYCPWLTSLNLSNFNTSSVTNMSYMFSTCNNLVELNISSFDTSKVTDMSYMFRRCGKLTSLDLSNFDTSKVTEWYDMFYKTFAGDPENSTLIIGTNFTNKGEAFRKISLSETTSLSGGVKVIRDGDTL